MDFKQKAHEAGAALATAARQLDRPDFKRLLRRRRARWLRSVALMAAFVSVGLLMTLEIGFQNRADSEQPPPADTDFDPVDTPKLETANTSSASPGEWTVAPAHKVVGRELTAVVWTGEELLFWGGENQSDTDLSAEGAAFDPVAEVWRDLSPGPLPPRSGHVAVWTGAEVLICCGRSGGGDPDAAAAYDPATDQWRPIASPPIRPLYAEALWTGRELLLFGGVLELGQGSSTSVAAYDPRTNSWRQLADAPYGFERLADSALGDGEVFVWPSTAGGISLPPLVYDIASDRWTQLPEPPKPAPQSASLVWTGSELFAFGIHLEAPANDSAVALVYDPDLERWTRTEAVPLPKGNYTDGAEGSQSAVLLENEIAVWPGWLGNPSAESDAKVILYDLRTDGWREILGAPVPAQGMWQKPLIWTGSELVVATDPVLKYRRP